MIWLRNLKKVKEELRNERWPRSVQEGFYLERLSGDIDIPYIKSWANRLGIYEELNYILNL